MDIITNVHTFLSDHQTSLNAHERRFKQYCFNVKNKDIFTPIQILLKLKKVINLYKTKVGFVHRQKEKQKAEGCLNC